ncbi:TetR family transcriptional regulator C-terminal domain-containing protein [Streptomyces sp. L7]
MWTEWAEALHAHYAEQGPNCDLSALMAQLDPSMPGIRDIVVDLYERWESALANGIRAMQASGRIRTDLDARATSIALVAGIQGGVVQMLATGSADRLRTVLRTGIASLRA